MSSVIFSWMSGFAAAVAFTLLLPDSTCMTVTDDGGAEWVVCNVSYKTGRVIEGDLDAMPE